MFTTESTNHYNKYRNPYDYLQENDYLLMTKTLPFRVVYKR